MMLNNFIEVWRKIKPMVFSCQTTLIISLVIISYYVADAINRWMW